jgi:glycine/D-amino acid oxidase-like deaminating enzyme
VGVLLDRRSFAAGSAALLSGCATVGTRPVAPSSCTPLPKVLVDQGRVIRTVAGLRPYRRSGFVVRAEPLGDKRLVHNYGHGGAVAVIGAGVMGLSTARLVQEAGFPVTIYAAALPPDTTSNIAGGQFHPAYVFSDDAASPELLAQFARALDYSWRRFQIMVGDDYGVRWLPTYVEAGSPEEKVIATFPPINRMLTESEHPFPWADTLRYDTVYVETGRYLRQMERDVRLAGGRVEVRRFAAPADIAALPERLVFNCTGLGSRELFGDAELVPVRGQLAILEPQPEVRYAALGGFGYMFPRPDGIVLGGTFERGVWDTNPQPADIERIVASNRRFFARFRCTA